MRMLFLILSVAMGCFFVACDDDDDNFRPDELQIRAFEQKYPGITPRGWEQKGEYGVAEFYENGVEKEAWFGKDGTWYMTESDITFEALPEPVKVAFRAGEYAQWRIDDVDMLERAGMQDIYIVEVEQGEQEIDLHFTADGTLIKTVADTDENGHWPVSGLPQKVKDFLNTHYTGARIIEYEREKGILEVDIYHGEKYKEVKFDSEDQWMLTEWELRQTEVPADVLEVIRREYPAYRIGDIDFIEKASESFYLFELEQGEREVHVKVSEDGTLLA